MKKNLNVVALVVAFFSVFAGQLPIAFAAPGNLSLEVSRNKVAVGETFEMTLRFQGLSQGDFALKLPPGLRSIGESSSSSFRMINGESSSETALSYEILVEREGNFKLGPFETTVSGQKYASNAVDLVATPPQISGKRPAGSASASGVGAGNGKRRGAEEQVDDSSQDEPPFSINVQVSNPTVYVGEQTFVTILLQNPEDSAHVQYRELTFPELSGFQVEDVGKPQTSSEIQNGRRYTTARVVKRLTPLKAGVVQVEGVRAVADILTPAKRRSQGGFFGSLMTDYDRQTRALSAEPVSITVKALPEDAKPQDFSGLVGDTTWSIHFPVSGAVRTGDSITVTVSVASTGDLSGIKLAPPKVSGGVKIYEDNPEARIERRGDKILQVKDFKFASVFTRPGNATLSPIRLTFFSTSEEKYQTLEYAFPVIVVQGAAIDDDRGVVSSPLPAAGVNVGGAGDLFPIKSDLSDFAGSPLTRSNFWLALAFPAFSFLFYALAAGSQRFRERLPLLSRFMRKRGALAKALAELAKLSKLLQTQSGEKLSDKCSDALRVVKEYLGSRTEQSLTQKTNAELQEILGSGIAPEFFALLAELEAQVYSSGQGGSFSGSKETQNILETMKKLEFQLKQVDGKL